MPSTSTSTVSPALSDTLGSRAQPTPGGVPVRIRSPGSSVKTFEQNATRNGDAEDQVVGRPVLEHLAVQPLHDAQPAPVAELRDGHEAIAERTERVEALRPGPLALRVLDVPGRHVVRTAVPAHMLERPRLRDPAAADADLDTELRFGVHMRRLWRDDDRFARADQRVLELAEEQRLGRRIVAELGGVLRIVSPYADDLHAADIGLRLSTATRRSSMALSFGVTVLPDPPYTRMIELMQFAEAAGLRVRVDVRLARPLAGVDADAGDRRRPHLEDQARPHGHEPGHARPDGARKRLRDAARHLERPHDHGHRPRRLRAALHRPAAGQGRRVRGRTPHDQAVHERQRSRTGTTRSSSSSGCVRSCRKSRCTSPATARRRSPSQDARATA